MLRRFTLITLFTLVSLLTVTYAQAKTTFKIGTLAPDGSVWTLHFKNFIKEVEEKTQKEVTFKLYPGGIMGDDITMYRKMRAGQLHGGGFTMAGIAGIIPDFQILSIPFLFENYQEIDNATRYALPYFKEEFAKKGLELIGFSEVGFIYQMSSSPIATLDDLQTRKSWTPSGDKVSATFLKSLGITSIPLTIPDVLSSIQTGFVDTVYNSLYGTIIMQWFHKASYITDVPYGYAYGGIALSRKHFLKLSKETQNIIHQAAQKHFTVLNSETRRLNLESREVLQKKGSQFVQATEESIALFKNGRDTTIEMLQDKFFSKKGSTKLAEIIEQTKQMR